MPDRYKAQPLLGGSFQALNDGRLATKGQGRQADALGWLAVAEHTSISCQGVRSRDRLRPDRPSMMESADSKMSSPLLGPSRSMGSTGL